MQKFYRVNVKSEYSKAGSSDIIALNPVRGNNPIFCTKVMLELLGFGVAKGELIHVSGPTGVGKTSTIEAICHPSNFVPICKGLGLEPKKINLFPVEMAQFDSPSELLHRRAIRNGNTFDEDSIIVKNLKKIAHLKYRDTYNVVWLRELGRVHSSSIMGPLLDLMQKNQQILLPDGKYLKLSHLAWLVDSNYQAEEQGNYVLVQLDEALKRRFTFNLTFNYLSLDQEEDICKQLCEEQGLDGMEEVISDVVRIGHEIRARREKGELLSLTAPTIYGYMAALRIKSQLSQISFIDVLRSTLLGNASVEDLSSAMAVVNDCVGVDMDEELEALTAGVGL